MSSSSVTAWIEPYSQRLSDFSREIENCINNSNWEMLESVLASRQAYLETILSNPRPDESRDAVKQLLERLLEQDAVFQEKIQDQKNRLFELQSLLERGRRAVQAYNEH